MRRRTLLGAAAALFGPEPRDRARPPRIRQVALPGFDGANAIWGATGSDQRGGIWAGISAVGGGGSAHLAELDPTIFRARDRGDVVGELARLGLLRPGETQNKLHTKLVQAADGWLYFASTDEAADNDLAPPRWGSHLWRLRPGEGRWDHVLAVPEGLIALGGAAGGIFAFGLWDHVLYRYDTATGQTMRTVVGAPLGHMSRNLLVDRAGHAYVPRVTLGATGLDAVLVEYGPALEIIAETPLEYYAVGADPAVAQGITAFVELADGAILFATAIGYLYRVTPRAGGASVLPLGWLHPSGTAFTPALFTWDGVRHVCGLARFAPNVWDWVVYDLRERQGVARPFPHGETEKPLLLYGCNTRDEQGRFYIAGRRRRGTTREPVLWQLDTL